MRRLIPLLALLFAGVAQAQMPVPAPGCATPSCVVTITAPAATTFTGASITASSPTLTVPGVTFTAGNVGNIVVVSGAGAGGAPLATTIAAYVSAHVVTLAANASTTVPTYTATRSAPVTATSQSGAGSYVPGQTSTLTDGTVLTVATTKVMSATGGSAGAGPCTNGTYTVVGSTGLGPNGLANRFDASITVTSNAATVNSITYAGDYGTNPTTITSEPVVGVTGCTTQPTLNVTMGVLTAYVSTPHADTSIPSDPVAQSATSGSGTGAAFTLTSTWVATGQGYFGPDAYPAYNAALTAACVGSTDANFALAPGGDFILGTQLELPTACPVTLIGQGRAATTLHAGVAGMTAVVHRGTAFGYGGGLQDITVDAFNLANEAVYTEGGARQLYENVIATNALTADVRCGDGTTHVYENHFTAVTGYTDPAVFVPSQMATYGFWSNATPTNGCTDSVVDTKSAFYNASVADMFDDAGGANTYIAPHVYGYPVLTWFPTYGIELSGLSTLTAPQSDGALTSTIYLNGSKISLLGGVSQWTGDSQGSSDGVLIASGGADDNVSGFSALGSYGVSAVNAVVQAGTAATTTTVANNPGASYTTPILAPLGTQTNLAVEIGSPTYGFYRDGSNNLYGLANGTFAFTWNSAAFTFDLRAAFAGLTYYTGVVKTTPSTAGIITFAATQRVALIVPSTTLATLTVTLPACAAANDGDERTVIISQIISALTVGAASGSVVSPPTVGTAGQHWIFHCYGADTAWY